MDTGELITILFWGAVILFSILQGAAQQKKQRDQERRKKEEADQDFDFPELDEAEVWGADETARDMVPEDVWEEISDLARGESRGPEVPEPVEAREESPSDRSPREEPVSYDRAVEDPGEPPTRKELERKARRLEAEIGGPSRARPRPVGLSVGRTGGGAGSGLLSDLSGDQLRRAFVLHEVLGPPVSKRERGRGGR